MSQGYNPPLGGKEAILTRKRVEVYSFFKSCTNLNAHNLQFLLILLHRYTKYSHCIVARDLILRAFLH